jgi:hypothetical protein
MISDFYVRNCYTLTGKKHKDICIPRVNGVSNKTWNALHKDLTILKLIGKIEFESLEKLYEEYKEIKKKKHCKRLRAITHP